MAQQKKRPFPIPNKFWIAVKSHIKLARISVLARSACLTDARRCVLLPVCQKLEICKRWWKQPLSVNCQVFVRLRKSLVASPLLWGLTMCRTKSSPFKHTFSSCSLKNTSISLRLLCNPSQLYTKTTRSVFSLLTSYFCESWLTTADCCLWTEDSN